MVTMLFVKCLYHSRSLVVISGQPMRLILVDFFSFKKTVNIQLSALCWYNVATARFSVF